MTAESESLRRRLREAGISPRAIRAVWPEWWSSDAEASFSATTELRYTVARRLGMSPRSLFDDSPKFVWKDDAKFKNLGTESEHERNVLTSFGVAVGRCAVEASDKGGDLPQDLTAQKLRSSILASSHSVGLFELLLFCWSVGIPVLQLALFPLNQKRMHAIAVRAGDRYAVLIGRESKFPSQIAYMLGHEIGHIVLHHVSESAALLDIENPLQMNDPDDEERLADRFALELLTGDEDPDVASNRADFTARQLAQAAIEASRGRRIDPGVLALCLGHSTGRWPQTFGALKLIPPGEVDVGGMINELARSQLDWGSLSLENHDYLSKVLGGSSEP